MTKIKTKQDKHCVFSPEGELNIYTAQQNRAVLEQVMADCQSLSVDLSGVTELDTSGVQILLLAMVESKRRGIPVEFYGHTEAVNQVLRLCNLNSVIGARDSVRAGKSGSVLS